MSDRWQLRVYPADAAQAGPFELYRPGLSVSDEDAIDLRFDETELPLRLAALAEGGSGRPLLAPHEDSRSQDLLSAANAIESHWPKRRRVVVIPALSEVAKR